MKIRLRVDDVVEWRVQEVGESYGQRSDPMQWGWQERARVCTWSLHVDILLSVCNIGAMGRTLPTVAMGGSASCTSKSIWENASFFGSGDPSFPTSLLHSWIRGCNPYDINSGKQCFWTQQTCLSVARSCQLWSYLLLSIRHFWTVPLDPLQYGRNACWHQHHHCFCCNHIFTDHSRFSLLRVLLALSPRYHTNIIRTLIPLIVNGPYDRSCNRFTWQVGFGKPTWRCVLCGEGQRQGHYTLIRSQEAHSGSCQGPCTILSQTIWRELCFYIRWLADSDQYLVIWFRHLRTQSLIWQC